MWSNPQRVPGGGATRGAVQSQISSLNSNRSVRVSAGSVEEEELSFKAQNDNGGGVTVKKQGQKQRCSR